MVYTLARMFDAHKFESVCVQRRKAGRRVKRQNFVVLEGCLRDCTPRMVDTERGPAPALMATLVTDHAAYGGHHRVLFRERLGAELRAFLAAAGSDGVNVVVDGHTASQGAEAYVEADRVLYHAPDEVRRKAALITGRLLGRSGA